MMTIIRNHGARMKLARPDIRHPRIVLVGSETGDDAGLVAALRKRGLHARWLSWDDPDTLHADLVILRTVTRSTNSWPGPGECLTCSTRPM
jgi:hypothetical protein